MSEYLPKRTMTADERMYHSALWTLIVDALDPSDTPPRDIWGDQGAIDAYHGSLAEVSTMSERFQWLCALCGIPAKELRDRVCNETLPRELALKYLNAVKSND